MQIEVVERPSVIEHLSWKTTPPMRASASTRGRTVKIVHPLMHKCAEICTDPTWERIFRRAAKGRMPSHFVLKEDRLSVKIRKKIVSVIIPPGTTEAMEVFKRFVDNYDNIYTDQDQNTPPDAIAVRNSLAKNLAHRRKFRRNMLNRFVQRMTEKHELDKAESQELSFTVHMGFQLNFLRSRDIIVDNEQREIIGIRDLEFSDKHSRFDLHRRVFSVAAHKRKTKPVIAVRPLDIDIRNLLLERVKHRYDAKVAATAALEPHRPEDDNLNLTYMHMISDSI
jgi:hypothetical protein